MPHQQLSQFLLRAGGFASVQESFRELAAIFREFGLDVGRMGLAIIPIYDSLDGIHLLTTDEAEGEVLRLDREAGFFDSEEHRSSIIAHVMYTHTPIRLHLAEGEGCERYAFLQELRDRGFSDYLITPIGRQETVRFILSVTTRRPSRWSDGEMAMMSEFFTVLGYVVESFELSRMIFLASQDPLSRLFNRRAFDHEARKALEHAEHRKAWSAMIFFDIDRFKSINDTYGHDVGDRCIVQAASAARAVGEAFGGICGRVGGEEFVIFLPELAAEGDARPLELLFEKIRGTSLEHADSGVQVSFTVSAGCVRIPPASRPRFEAIMKRASHLMHRAKEAGRDRYVEGAP